MAYSELDDITLESGAHTVREDGMCAMEAVAWLAGEPHSDHPECACPVITRLVRAWNDALPNEARQRLLKPLLPLLVGSKSTPQVEEQRAYMALDWLVRVHTPAWLRLTPKLTADAEALSGLPAITDRDAATAAGAVVRAAEKHAAAAWDAAWADALAGAMGAMGVVGTAARVTPGAAGNAARGAIGYAAQSAFWSTAWDAAWGAIAYATQLAFWGTAWAAAWDAMWPTVMELQDSCAELIRRMAAIRG